MDIGLVLSLGFLGGFVVGVGYMATEQRRYMLRVLDESRAAVDVAFAVGKGWNATAHEIIQGLGRR